MPANPEVPFWEVDPDAWDTFKVGDFALGGIATVKVRKASVQDPQGTPGGQGMDLIHTGYELAEILISLRMYTQAHLDSYMEFLDLIQPSSDGSPPLPLRCYHPALAVMRISEVYFRMWTPPEPSAVKGVWEAVITATEFDPRNKHGNVFKPDGARLSDEPQVSFGETREKDAPSKNPGP